MNIRSIQSRNNRLRANYQPVLSVLAPLLLAVILASAVRAFAEEGAQEMEGWGTTACSAAADVQPAALPPIRPFFVAPKSGYGTAGVALRNRGAGSISISGVVAPVKAAFIYWAVISSGAPPAAATSVQLQRQFPLPASAVVVLPGAVVGAGPPPCWPGTVITVFRAAVPLAVANGNGLYKVTLLRGAAGTTNGSDPWLVVNLPLWEGASIVMVGAGVGTVSLYDAGLAGNTFKANIAFPYTLVLPVPAPGVRTLFDNIGADGKHVLGKSRLAVPTMSNEMTTINGFPTAGPGSAYFDSDWNGSSGLPVPELWDDTGHDITPAAPGGTPVLNVVIFNGGGIPADCLTPVANVVETD